MSASRYLAALRSSRQAPAAPAPGHAAAAGDVVLFAGGPVWALDWCPLPPHLTVGPWQYLAVGCHSAREPHHLVGQPAHGPGLIQIWAVSLAAGVPAAAQPPAPPMASASGKQRGSLPLATGRGRGRRGGGGSGGGRGQAAAVLAPPQAEPPVGRSGDGGDGGGRATPQARLAFAIAHSGQLVRDARWKPLSPSAQAAASLGLLAVALGDGAVHVYDVPPEPPLHDSRAGNKRSTDGGSGSGGGTAPALVALAPSFTGRVASLPLALAWGPPAASDRLLAGYHDGTVNAAATCRLLRVDAIGKSRGHWLRVTFCNGCQVAVWGVKVAARGGEAQQDARPLLCFTADCHPVRSLAWAPNNSRCTASEKLAGDPLACSCTQACERGGREFYRPVWQITVSSCWILALEWIAYPRCLIAGLEDGKVRTLALDLGVSFLPACESLPTTAAGHAFSSHPCLPSAIWALVVSCQIGLTAYGGADGAVQCFQLTERAVSGKSAYRHREPHHAIGGFQVDVVTESSLDASNTGATNGIRDQILVAKWPSPNEHRLLVVGW
eukprot:SM000352S13429  [mRNA]  locus=s352:4947:9012:- [translate_table: standard]